MIARSDYPSHCEHVFSTAERIELTPTMAQSWQITGGADQPPLAKPPTGGKHWSRAAVLQLFFSISACITWL